MGAKLLCLIIFQCLFCAVSLGGLMVATREARQIGLEGVSDVRDVVACNVEGVRYFLQNVTERDESACQ